MMVGAILWIVAVVFCVIGLTIAFVLNAKALWRDLDHRRSAFRAQLEADANALVDELFDSERPRS
jgi:hypothetical protein